MIEISLDDASTWPVQLRTCLDTNETLLRRYVECDRWRTDDNNWRKPSYVAQALRTPNQWETEFQELLEHLRSQFTDQIGLLGYHCTRLTEQEVARIRQQGMHLPNSTMLRERIEAIERDGLISDEIARKLCSENYADDPARSERIYFIFSKKLLKDQYGVQSPLTYWGGEALYACHDRDPEVGPILHSIGVPHIVEAAVPLCDIGAPFPAGVVVSQFLADRGIVASWPGEYADRTELPIPPNGIRRIISWHDREFEALTKCSTWERSPT